MDFAVFPNGYPDKIDARYFRSRYGDKFSVLLDDDKTDFLLSVIDDVYSMFWGVQQLWKRLPPEVWYSKTRLCFSLLVAWYITDNFPEYADGVASSSGIPLRAKSIGQIRLEFGETNPSQKLKEGQTDLLSMLRSNPFGNKAYLMIKSSPENLCIFTRVDSF